MSAVDTPCHLESAAAYVRGRAAGAVAVAAGTTWAEKPLDELSPAEMAAAVRFGLANGLRLHRFKRTAPLPRVRRVLGVLRGIGPADLLDVGSGRGAFLWTLLGEFPRLPVTAIDLLPHRTADMQAVRLGGLRRLRPVRMDATRLGFADGGFDMVTFLEVLEHIPDAGRALAGAVRVARRFVVLSVPSHADDNPEHIHLFDRRSLAAMFEQAGARRVTFEQVHNHLVAVARVGA